MEEAIESEGARQHVCERLSRPQPVGAPSALHPTPMPFETLVGLAQHSVPRHVLREDAQLQLERTGGLCLQTEAVTRRRDYLVRARAGARASGAGLGADGHAGATALLLKSLTPGSLRQESSGMGRVRGAVRARARRTSFCLSLGALPRKNAAFGARGAAHA